MFAMFVQTYTMSEKITLLRKELDKAKKELIAAELHVTALEMKITRITKEIAKSSPLKWALVIRRCMITENGQSTLTTVVKIVQYIERHMKLKADRNIKNIVVSTLSRMYTIKEICKTEYGGVIYYGYPDLFEDDRRTLKAKVRAVLDI